MHVYRAHERNVEAVVEQTQLTFGMWSNNEFFEFMTRPSLSAPTRIGLGIKMRASGQRTVLKWVMIRA